MPRDTKEALRRIEDALLELEEEPADETEETQTEEEAYFDYPEPEEPEAPREPSPRGGISCLAAFALMLMGGILVMLMLFWLKMQGIL